MVTISSALQDVKGVRVGHYTDHQARTGLTVIVFDALTLTAVEVRGSAPGSLNTAMLEPGMAAQQVDAILLTGGSSYGLCAADGVMQGLRERGRGIPFGNTVVPLVAGAVIFDLSVGEVVFPDVAAGRHALDTAEPLSEILSGRIGVGTGARLGTIRGLPKARPGGFGVAQVQFSLGTVTAFVALNALGATFEETLGQGQSDPRLDFIERIDAQSVPIGQNTTLVALVTDIACPYDNLLRCCVATHDALARVIIPAHTIADGDIAFASTLHEGSIGREDAMALTFACENAAEAALRNAGSLLNN